jgi:CheY-like chemotaxis protein
VLYYLTDLIEDLGHVALPAASAAEALALLEQGGPIDLLITDRSMPDMRGTDLALAVRERRPELPIILASGYGDNASSGGPDLPCLSKPFTISDLEMMITSLVQA